jgi:hypothetical protein
VYHFESRCPSLSQTPAFRGLPLQILVQSEAFKGSELGGSYFLIDNHLSSSLIASTPRHRPYLQRFLNGKDLLQRVERLGSRTVIYLADLTLDQARTTAPELVEILAKRRPSSHRTDWWRFRRPTPDLYRAIAGLREVIVCAETGDRWAIDRCPTSQVFSKSTIVFATSSDAVFAVIQSSFHEVWRLLFGPTLKRDARYSISDCFDTFPFPRTVEGNALLSQAGQEYYLLRRELMLGLGVGLTSIYNRFHAVEDASEAVMKLRELHCVMDRTVAAAYDWGDLDLGHGFHETRQGIGFTISDQARREVLRRLLKLNHERYTEEVRQGLHKKKKRRAPIEDDNDVDWEEEKDNLFAGQEDG